MYFLFQPVNLALMKVNVPSHSQGVGENKDYFFYSYYFLVAVSLNTCTRL